MKRWDKKKERGCVVMMGRWLRMRDGKGGRREGCRERE
jgi:hypothetical protein